MATAAQWMPRRRVVRNRYRGLVLTVIACLGEEAHAAAEQHRHEVQVHVDEVGDEPLVHSFAADAVRMHLAHPRVRR